MSVVRSGAASAAAVLTVSGVLVLGGFIGLDRARAQANDWLIVPSAVTAGAGTPVARRAASPVAKALGASVHLMTPDLARARFEQRGSTAPLMVSHGDLDALARDTQMALYHVASGLPAKARQDVTRALERADKVLESLNRESLAAQQLLDACLYLVRAHLQSNERQAAREQALQCRRLVPDIEPDGTMHPPEVIGILAEAEAELRQREPGSLRVESAPDGCPVYVNGRHLGEAPLELPQLSPGEYRVQAECEEGRVGRVHRVTIGSSRVVKRIDTRFDAAVQTSLDLSLHYESYDAQRDHAYADALELGRVVGASEVILIVPMSAAAGQFGEHVQLHRIRVQDGRGLSAVRMKLDEAGAVEPSALAMAARALQRGESVDTTQSQAGPVQDPELVVRAPPEATRAARPVANATSAPAVPNAGPPKTIVEREAGSARPVVEATAPAAPAAALAAEPSSPTNANRPPTALGIVLALGGGAAALTSWGLFGYQLTLEQQYRDRLNDGRETASVAHKLDGFRFVPFAVQAAGSALLVASEPWLLPEATSSRIPTLAYVAGGVGAAIAITGAAMLIRGGLCNDFDQLGRCVEPVATTGVGAVVLAAGVPFLTVPVVYLLRHAPSRRDTDVALRLSAGAGGGQLTLRGDL